MCVCAFHNRILSQWPTVPLPPRRYQSVHLQGLHQRHMPVRGRLRSFTRPDARTHAVLCSSRSRQLYQSQLRFCPFVSRPSGPNLSCVWVCRLLLPRRAVRVSPRLLRVSRLCQHGPVQHQGLQAATSRAGQCDAQASCGCCGKQQ